MLKMILEGAKSGGNEIEMILLRKMNIKHCGGSSCCEKTEECKIKDDMQGIYPKLLESDVLILGSPSYYNNVTGMMKDFMDRTNPLYFSLKLKGKKVIIVCVGGVSKSAEKCGRILKDFAGIHKMKVVGSIKAEAEGAGEIGKNTKVMKKCFDLGRKLNNL
jgi:multimeric flavodoxin WrbA